VEASKTIELAPLLAQSCSRRHCTPGLKDFIPATFQNGKFIPKLPQNIPNVHKIYQTAIKYAKWQ
jgi:hypothetical protein